MSGEKTVFLDRDGVINVDTGHPHIIAEIQFVDGIFDLCTAARNLGYQIIIVTNQAGIAKGHYTEEQFFRVMDWMIGQFRQRGIKILDYYFCPHHVDGLGVYKKDCNHRKPEPGMILTACARHDIDLENSIIIGDKYSDMEAGRRAGIGTKFLFKSKPDDGSEVKNDIKNVTKLSEITQYLLSSISKGREN